MEIELLVVVPVFCPVVILKLVANVVIVDALVELTELHVGRAEGWVERRLVDNEPVMVTGLVVGFVERSLVGMPVAEPDVTEEDVDPLL